MKDVIRASQVPFFLFLMLPSPLTRFVAIIARAAEEDKAERGGEAVLPEPAGEQVVDYMAVSKAWKEERGWMDNQQNETGGK